MTASYIPLLAIQQRPHSRVYAMPAKDLTSTSEILAAGQAVRKRLRGYLPAHPKPQSSLNVVALPDTPKAHPSLPIHADSVPLDMLEPCSWKFLVKVVCLRHHQSTKEIFGHRREPDLVAARHLAMYLVATHTNHSIKRIAQKFNRDHATIFHALSRFPPIDRRQLSKPSEFEQMTSSDRTPAERAALIIRAYAAGVPRREIAEQLGMSLATVKRFAYLHNLRHATRPNLARKAANG